MADLAGRPLPRRALVVRPAAGPDPARAQRRPPREPERTHRGQGSRFNSDRAGPGTGPPVRTSSGTRGPGPRTARPTERSGTGWPCPEFLPRCGGRAIAYAGLTARTVANGPRPQVPDRPAGRYSAAIMVVPGWSRSVLAARSAASKASGWVSHQFITRNRRVAVSLALVTVFISVAAVHLSEAWFSPGLLILPVLAGGLLLWPRALRILFVLIAAGLAYDVVKDKAGPGLVLTIVVTAAVALVLASTREKLGMLGLRGEAMLIE